MAGPEEALPAGTRLTLFSDDRPNRFFTVIKFWMDETSGIALALKTGVPSYQVEDEEGRMQLLLHLPIEEENEGRGCLWRPDQAGFDSRSVFNGAGSCLSPLLPFGFGLGWIRSPLACHRRWMEDALSILLLTEHSRLYCLSRTEQSSIYRSHLLDEERRANDDLIDFRVISAGLYLYRIAFVCAREDGNALCTRQGGKANL
jgi:hypothetical protein